MESTEDDRASRYANQIQGLRKELDTGIENARRNGKRYRRWSFWLVLGTVIASFAGTILAGLDDVPKLALAITTALPGVLTLVSNSLKLEGRSIWFYKKRNALKSIRTRLLFPGENDVDIAALAKEQDDLRIQMSNGWAEQLTLVATQQQR